MIVNFGDRLTEASRKTGSVLCMGIDPHCELIPSIFGDASAEPGSSRAISAISDFVNACLDSSIGKVAAIKPQAAFFEKQGPDGMQLLQNLGKAAIDSGMLVIMDAKRGDIGSTSIAYADAWIGHDAMFPSDALTVNPWLGIDTLEPFLIRADSTGSGLFVLNRTSNAGAGDLQDLIVNKKPLFKHLATRLKPLAAKRVGITGTSSIGVVAGATWPKDVIAIRKILPNSPFLVPGFGAQGAGAKNATIGLKRGKFSWEGGIVNSTRALIFSKSATDASSFDEWRAAIDETITDSNSLLNELLH